MSDALRAKAEAENVRRRSEDEIAKARKFAVENRPRACCRSKTAWKFALAAHAAKPDTPWKPFWKA